MRCLRAPAWLLSLLLGLSLSVPARGQPAAGQFLVAARGLADPNFARSVVLLVEHDGKGSLGLVVNRPTGVALSRLFSELRGLEDAFLHAGGPVEAGRFLLLLRASRRPEDSRPVFADVYLGLSPAALRDPQLVTEFRVYAGYAGWAPGQLEAELVRRDWHLLPAEAPLVFGRQPERLWEDLIRRLEAPVALAPGLEVTR